MSPSAGELLGVPPPATPFDIMRAALVELRVTDLAASEHFYAELLGMIVTTRTDGAVYLRGWEERQHHSLVLRKSDEPAVARLGLRVRAESDLELLATVFERRELPVRWVPAGSEPGFGRALRVWDPLGYPLEFFHAIDRVETQHQRFDLHRGAPLLRFDHLNLHCPRVEEAFAF